MNSLSKGWVYVWEQDPPSNVELLAKSPAGLVHLVSWRPAYRIFTCQCKGEYSMDWCWKLIDLDVVTWDELKVIAGEIMNLGMELRQKQLSGDSSLSGNEVLEQYLSELKLKFK